MSNVEEVYNQCENRLPGHGPDKSMKAQLLELAETLEGHEMLDSYGSGEFLNDFEAEIAGAFGKEAGVFMPSGIMAQQAALRVWCERNGNFTVAMHPTAHLEFAEHAAYQFLHGLKRLQFGQPEFLRERMLRIDDFESLGSKPGAVLLELPYRPLGGQLPDWDTLVAIHGWAKERGIPLHMDGARIWSCRPFYEKEYHEIATLFDSVYVSFYKDLGGLAGAMILGTAEFIQEAKIWQTRHGGRLKTLSPYAASAKAGYERVTPVIHEFVAAARQAAEILSSFDEITIRPDPPHVNIFQLYIRGEADALNERHLQLAQETGTFLFWSLGESPVPGVAMTEIHCWEEAARFDSAAISSFVEKLLQD
jgi:threonine aldolase